MSPLFCREWRRERCGVQRHRDAVTGGVVTWAWGDRGCIVTGLQRHGLQGHRGAVTGGALSWGCRETGCIDMGVQRHGVQAAASRHGFCPRPGWDELLTGPCWEVLGTAPLGSLSAPELLPREQGARGTRPTRVKSYKGGNWPRSLKTMGLVFEFWLLLRSYLYAGFSYFIFF